MILVRKRMNNFVFCTYHWGQKYKEKANKWIQNCKKVKVEFHIEEISEFDKPNYYQKGINYKPTFIKRMLEKYPGKGIVYMDVDMVLNKYPLLFENANDVDFMCFNWNFEPKVINNSCIDPFTLETAGGLFFFNDTKPSKVLLSLWERNIKTKQYANKADDRVLAIVFKDFKCLHKVRCQWLPIEYFYIPQYFSHLKLGKDAVIVHPDDITPEEEAHKKGADINRIPKKYTLQRSVRDRRHLKLTEQPGDSKSLNKRLKLSGFKFDHYYKLPTNVYKCTTKGTLKILPHASPNDILKIWNELKEVCDIGIGKVVSKKSEFDVRTNLFDSKTGKLKMKRDAFIYMKKNNGTYNLVKQWYKQHKKGTNPMQSFMKTFNENASHQLGLRISSK